MACEVQAFHLLLFSMSLQPLTTQLDLLDLYCSVALLQKTDVRMRALLLYQIPEAHLPTLSERTPALVALF
jgi:hypothetical protein